MTLHTLLVTQTIVGVLGLIPSYMLGVASVISAANCEQRARLAAVVVYVGLALPVVLLLSLIGMWIANAYSMPQLTRALIFLPWAHLVLLVGSMLVLLRS